MEYKKLKRIISSLVSLNQSLELSDSNYEEAIVLIDDGIEMLQAGLESIEEVDNSCFGYDDDLEEDDDDTED